MLQILELYLVAFEPPLRDCFKMEELTQLYKMMHDKDLRICTDLMAFLVDEDERSESETLS